jgi:hypothetical protein
MSTINQLPNKCRHTDNGIILELDNGVEIELLVTDSEVLGLGAVWSNGIILRSNTAPLRPLIKSVDGYQFLHFHLRSIEPTADGGFAVTPRRAENRRANGLTATSTANRSGA